MSVQVDGNPYGEIYEEMPQHRHWDTYDMTLEGCRYNVLHELVAQPRFDAVRAEAVLAELEALAQSKGWGEADSFYSAGYVDDLHSEYAAAQRANFEEDPDSQYSNYQDRSFIHLEQAAATEEACAFLYRALCTVVDSRQTGRRLYEEQREISASAPSRGP